MAERTPASDDHVSNVKLLLDENLSPSIAVALCADGIDAAHVRDRGMRGATDARVLEKAYDEDRIRVTANVDDFEKLAHARECYPAGFAVRAGDGEREAHLTKIVDLGCRTNHDGGSCIAFGQFASRASGR